MKERKENNNIGNHQWRAWRQKIINEENNLSIERKREENQSIEKHGEKQSKIININLSSENNENIINHSNI